GWWDHRQVPQDMHLTHMTRRNYNVQPTDPTNNTNTASVGKRVTATEAGDYLISVRDWTGSAPQGMTRISSPNNSVLVVARTLVESDADVSAAHALSKQIHLTPLRG